LLSRSTSEASGSASSRAPPRRGTSFSCISSARNERPSRRCPRWLGSTRWTPLKWPRPGISTSSTGYGQSSGGRRRGSERAGPCPCSDGRPRSSSQRRRVRRLREGGEGGGRTRGYGVTARASAFLIPPWNSRVAAEHVGDGDPHADGIPRLRGAPAALALRFSTLRGAPRAASDTSPPFRGASPRRFRFLPTFSWSAPAPLPPPPHRCVECPRAASDTSPTLYGAPRGASDTSPQGRDPLRKHPGDHPEEFPEAPPPER